MATSRDSTHVKKRRYRFMHRTPAALAVPADLAEWTTLKGTFTEGGFCRDGSIKLAFTEGDEEILDDGSKLKLGINAAFEMELLQTDPADYTDYEALENVATDVILVDEITNVAIFIGNALLFFGESVESGGTEFIPARFEADNISAKSVFRTRFAIPTV